MRILAVACAALAAMLMVGRTPARARLAAILDLRGPPTTDDGRTGAPSSARSRGWSPAWFRTVASALAGVGAALVVEGWGGLTAGVVIGAGAWHVLGRVEPAGRRARDREQIVAALPLAADLLVAALEAGSPPVRAVEAVGSAVGGPLGRTLVAAAQAAQLGDPSSGWRLLVGDAAVRPLGRALAASVSRGTSPVQVLERVAVDARDAARWAGEARARSLGAKAAAPLGLCFLPAFVLVGIVPIVATSGALLP